MADRGRGRRMAKEWDTIPSINLTLTTDNTLLGGALPIVEAKTVLRMIGEYVISPTGTITGGDACFVAVAIGVVSSDAFAVGPSAVPDPAAEGEYPWLYYRSHPFWFPSAGAPLEPGSVGNVVRVPFDIRSMRKLKPRESLVFVAQYVDVSGTPPMNFMIGTTRVLLAE